MRVLVFRVAETMAENSESLSRRLHLPIEIMRIRDIHTAIQAFQGVS